ncbi:tRNA (adenosine(37)-N6)-threonylcarbamoyltransferase complex ATPase subunit type 1 TsaE [Candidatus Daviesbacteria bacterium]|nr:tRNA (adenosine(37)-N6)-threonylcarbamoyltransferase complex ATPase subunit type 1 TsaE [Candidatus Daviesbacteria bacterium]
MVHKSSSAYQTQKIAQNLAKKYKLKGDILALTGDLGSGKTTFAQGFAKGLGIKEKIISPTFVLIRQHKIPGTQRTFYHIDLYRLDIIEDIKSIGIKEILEDKDNLILIEWAEKIEKLLPDSTLKIHFEKTSDLGRKIWYT